MAGGAQGCVWESVRLQWKAALWPRWLFRRREEQGTSAEGVKVGDLPGGKRQPDQALIDLFRDYGGGQAGREGCPQGAVEQALRL